MAEIPSLNVYYTKTKQEYMAFEMVAIERQNSSESKIEALINSYTLGIF